MDILHRLVVLLSSARALSASCPDPRHEGMSIVNTQRQSRRSHTSRRFWLTGVVLAATLLLVFLVRCWVVLGQRRRLEWKQWAIGSYSGFGAGYRPTDAKSIASNGVCDSSGSDGIHSWLVCPASHVVVSMPSSKENWMRQFIHGFANLGAFAVVYLLPPVVVELVRWAITGSTHPTPNDLLFVVFGIWTMHSLLRRWFSNPEDLPLV